MASVPCCSGDLCSWHFHDSYVRTDGLPEGQKSLYALPKAVGGGGGGLQRGNLYEERYDLLLFHHLLYRKMHLFNSSLCNEPDIAFIKVHRDF